MIISVLGISAQNVMLRLCIHRVRIKGTDSILAVTSTNLDNFSQFLARIILTIHVTEILENVS